MKKLWHIFFIFLLISSQISLGETKLILFIDGYWGFLFPKVFGEKGGFFDFKAPAKSLGYDFKYIPSNFETSTGKLSLKIKGILEFINRKKSELEYYDEIVLIGHSNGARAIIALLNLQKDKLGLKKYEIQLEEIHMTTLEKVSGILLFNPAIEASKVAKIVDSAIDWLHQISKGMNKILRQFFDKPLDKIEKKLEHLNLGIHELGNSDGFENIDIHKVSEGIYVKVITSVIDPKKWPHTFERLRRFRKQFPFFPNLTEINQEALYWIVCSVMYMIAQISPEGYDGAVNGNIRKLLPEDVDHEQTDYDHYHHIYGTNSQEKGERIKTFIQKLEEWKIRRMENYSN